MNQSPSQNNHSYEDGSREFYGVSNLRPHCISDGVFLRTTNINPAAWR